MKSFRLDKDGGGSDHGATSSFDEAAYSESSFGADPTDPSGLFSTSNSNRQQRQQSQHDDGKRSELVWRETQAVQRTKIISFIAIVIIGAVVSVAAYLVIWFDEEDDFRTQFRAHAKEIAQVSETTLQRSFSIVGSLSKSVTNAATMMNQTFPFVTIPNFDEVGGDAKSVSDVDVIILAPLVRTDQLDAWETYTRQNSDWVQQGLVHRGMSTVDPGPVPYKIHPTTPHEHKVGDVHIPGYYMPVWQMAQAPVNASIVNRDLFTSNSFEHRAWDVMKSRRPILSDACDFSFLAEYDVVADPFSSYLIEPIFDQFGATGEVVAYLIAVFPWHTYFHDIMMDDVEAIHVVVDDDCGDTMTYELQGPKSIYVGEGDLHETHRNFKEYAYKAPFATSWEYEGPPHEPVNGTSYDDRFTGTSRGHCKFSLTIYATSALRDSQPSYARFAAIAIASVFVIILCFLLLYDVMVTRRQTRLMATATRTNAIVKDLFPEEVQARLMAEKEQAEKQAKTTMNSLLNTAMDYWSVKSVGQAQQCKEETPIADLFPATTIFFADIVGFTAWSSSREPTQVFALLERLYSEFDQVADARHVFKVETVGDCYVAVTGLPNRRKDHAVAMARFATDCLSKFGGAVKQLEVSLGPDTADLGLRVGIHSGAVTAGVLRGDRARFQLFGDTMNTASRMESTSKMNRIQLSEQTASLLRDAGKGHWIKPRTDKVVAKGKGELSTYWLCLRSRSHEDTTSSTEFNLDATVHGGVARGGAQTDESRQADAEERRQRLVEWNRDCLLRFLNEIQSKRSAEGQLLSEAAPGNSVDSLRLMEFQLRHPEGTPLDQVADEIPLVSQSASPVVQRSSKTIYKDESVSEAAAHQLHHFVEAISTLYRASNAFNNFEHASHVCMLLINMLHRAEASHEERMGAETLADKEEVLAINELARAVSGDPLTRFACAFSALIHGAQHMGIPNAQLVGDKTSLSASYDNESVQQQNAFDISWELFMGDNYEDLRFTIYQTEEEYQRFRQLVLNLVLATDMQDAVLNKRRQERWDKAFPKEQRGAPPEPVGSDVALLNRQATLVLEYMVQAADVSHSMQHWHVYLKWHQAYFMERFKAFAVGRAGGVNPACSWFSMETRFFDETVLPLAQKLVQCGVLGALGEEFLRHAEQNRDEWSRKGEDVISAMVEQANVLVHTAIDDETDNTQQVATPTRRSGRFTLADLHGDEDRAVLARSFRV